MVGTDAVDEYPNPAESSAASTSHEGRYLPNDGYCNGIVGLSIGRVERSNGNGAPIHALRAE